MMVANIKGVRIIESCGLKAVMKLNSREFSLYIVHSYTLLLMEKSVNLHHFYVDDLMYYNKGSERKEIVCVNGVSVL